MSEILALAGTLVVLVAFHHVWRTRMWRRWLRSRRRQKVDAAIGELETSLARDQLGQLCPQCEMSYGLTLATCPYCGVENPSQVELRRRIDQQVEARRREQPPEKTRQDPAWEGYSAKTWPFKPRLNPDGTVPLENFLQDWRVDTRIREAVAQLDKWQRSTGGPTLVVRRRASVESAVGGYDIQYLDRPR